MLLLRGRDDGRCLPVQRSSGGSLSGSASVSSGLTARKAFTATSGGRGTFTRSSRSSGVGLCLVVTVPAYAGNEVLEWSTRGSDPTLSASKATVVDQTCPREGNEERP